jgi:hypothetical protein
MLSKELSKPFWLALLMSGSSFQRTSAVFSEVNEITPEDAGRRVQIMGFVVDFQDESVFILSDDTGQIIVICQELPTLQSFIRVFGSIAVTNEGQPMIRAEIIQDLSGLDKKLFRDAFKLLQTTFSGRKV